MCLFYPGFRTALEFLFHDFELLGGKAGLHMYELGVGESIPIGIYALWLVIFSF